jgi:hypothetical protein
MFEIRSLLLAGEVDEATRLVAQVLSESFAITCARVDFTLDAYSLNSVSGRVTQHTGTSLFFKFHTEEDETRTASEYYRGEVLRTHGIPVDAPLAVCTTPGSQVALYELRTQPRMADVCMDLERSSGRHALLPEALFRARQALDDRLGAVLVSTLRVDALAARRSSLHSLFFQRLVDDGETFPGGRYRRWYLEDPQWARLADKRWRVNGVEYALTLRQLAEGAHEGLRPDNPAWHSVAVAHGDDHQGNVWLLHDEAGTPYLQLFDAAFAGGDLPALLAPIKATFHNVFAHPFWLYHPEDADRSLHIEVAERDDFVVVQHDLPVSPLRQQILQSVVEHVWVPLLTALASRGQLVPHWRAVIRLALFACPFLVTNLLSPARMESIRILGLAQAVSCGSEPLAGRDGVTVMLDRLEQVVGSARGPVTGEMRGDRD